jgi:hypothetical protein
MSWTPTDEQGVATALDPFVTLPADKRDWSASVRDAYEHHAVTDFTEAYAAARRVYLREAARAVLVAVGPHIAAQALRDAAGDMDAEYEDRTAKVGAYGQMKIRAALLTGAGYARKRADQIEKEAGR